MEKRVEERIIRVAVIGPESTGKSDLCSKLAGHYNTVFVPEFARSYLNEIARPYTYEDVIYITEQQLRLEKELESRANKLIFCDTTLITIKIWFEVVFKKVPEEIQGRLNQVKYDHYLLMDIDMAWQPDPLREHPHFRKELFEMHLHELNQMNARFEIISGWGNQRILNAISSVDKVIY